MQQKLLNRQLEKSLRDKPSKIKYIPSLFSALRIVVLPFLAYSFFVGLGFIASALFLLVIGTDFVDGFLARKLAAASKFGAYFDASVDFVVILGMFRVFVAAGFYPYWILLLLLFVYVQFIITSFFSKIFYDPIGKYYGSMLYGAIGLTLLFSGQSFYDIITFSIVAVTAASLCCRIAYFFRYRIQIYQTSFTIRKEAQSKKRGDIKRY